MAETIRFQIGRPEYVALKYPKSKAVQGRYGEQMLFSTTDDRAFYLDPDPAYAVESELSELGIRPGQQFKITKCKASHGGHTFQVERAAGDSGGYNVPTRAAGALYESAPARTAVSNGDTEQHHPTTGKVQPLNSSSIVGSIVLDNIDKPTINPATALLCSAFKTAIDAVAEAQAYANRRGLGITFSSEDVRSTAISCYIGAQKGGRY